jgi:hypothetical protein
MFCSECPTSIAGRRRLTCSATCRKRRERRLHAEQEARFREVAEALLIRQTDALIAGDLDALRAIQHEAASLFV